MSNYYKSNVTGNLISDSSFYVLDSIFGKDYAGNLVANGILIKHEPPTVIDFVQENSKILAIRRYMEIHKCGFVDAKHKVDMMFEDKEKFAVKNKLLAC